MDRLTEYLEELIEEVEVDEGYEVEYSVSCVLGKARKRADDSGVFLRQGGSVDAQAG